MPSPFHKPLELINEHRLVSKSCGAYKTDSGAASNLQFNFSSVTRHMVQIIH